MGDHMPQVSGELDFFRCRGKWVVGCRVNRPEGHIRVYARRDQIQGGADTITPVKPRRSSRVRPATHPARVISLSWTAWKFNMVPPLLPHYSPPDGLILKKRTANSA
jgi:hypothetical protein